MAPGDPVPDRTWQVRLLALLAFVPAVVAMTLVVADVKVVSVETWRLLVPLPLVAMVVQFLAVLVLTSRGRGPAAFAVSAAGEFRLRVRPVVACAFLPWAVGNCLELFHPDWGDALTRGAVVSLVGVCTVSALLALVAPVAVALSPEGVRLFRGRVMPWDAPVVPPMGLLRWADVNRMFLADAILYYRAHPEFRSEIGTPAEHRRLYAVLVSARVSA
ncbi:hypothetical protein [Hamadaea tsunoensis]|uniref:hypothetical protein n=1 Tax=Hamadaea tsunoensis TaxID=53368 RepID=UPI0004020B40|nr:hypothetical protein [Hamadaea tsunoensis]